MGFEIHACQIKTNDHSLQISRVLFWRLSVFKTHDADQALSYGGRVVGRQTMSFTHDLFSGPENAPALVGAVER